ncbi:Uncharacterised protein [Amycolatopsis camponoti]|uniref:Uncharacterized protein n=1 Tax=Amycolatopsis camponoti TaxID=2606593 RepID=A0A6I8M9Y5_9PSEU|nr:hypothetical protein [Amycolatopsis camponoti]VVJ24864.1 Uncharacterised protein [Amycolatopsis camponoti]
MEPITLILLALLAGAGTAAIVVDVLSWRTVDSFIMAQPTTSGSAEIIKNRLASGRYQVVAGVFSPLGTKVATRSWEASTLEPLLQNRFGNRDAIKITF